MRDAARPRRSGARRAGGVHGVRGAREPRHAAGGSQTLTLCGRAPAAYCGTLSVPLDHLAPAGPRIAIAFSLYPASAPAGAGALAQIAGTVGREAVSGTLPAR